MNHIISYLLEHWKIWIQIALVCVGLYYLLRGLAKTPGKHAVYGIGAFLTLYALLKILEFNIIVHLLESILQVGVIALVVLFREEARDFLTRIGRKVRGTFAGFGRPNAHQIQVDAIEEIAAAVSRLAATGYGASIVIEMEDSLEEIISTGHEINANLSAPLIEAIFTSRSPIHDGAIVIRDTKIVAASAVLPLYKGDSPDLRRRGTRHRAALGLSSVNDAAVVVVSEEDGLVRVARHGRFIAVSKEHLRHDLISILANEDEPNSPNAQRFWWSLSTLSQVTAWPRKLMKRTENLRSKTTLAPITSKAITGSEKDVKLESH